MSKRLVSSCLIGADGLIPIPEIAMEELRLAPDSQVDMYLVGNTLEVVKHTESCHSCGSENVTLVGFLGNLYCLKCAGELGRIFNKLENIT